MILDPVEGSSNIIALGYDAATKTLGVQFKSGAIYHYKDVSQGVHDRFKSAGSAGRFFAAEVKDHFKHTRIK